MKNKTKVKVLAAAVAVIIVAVAVLGSTLAWFTDEDEAVNVFTIGKISIKLHDENKSESSGTCGSDFTQEQALFPVLSNDAASTDESYIDKIVHVENDGANDAYVRAFIGYPEELDGMIHLDLGTSGWTAETPDPEKVTIEGVKYKVLQFIYGGALEAGKMTEDLLTGVYLDQSVDIRSDEGIDKLCTVAEDGTVTFSDYDIATLGKISIPVAVQAVQTKGFEDAVTALDTSFPEGPWEAGAVEVASVDDFATALSEAESGTVIELAPLEEDASYGTLEIPADLEGVTITSEDGAKFDQIKIPVDAEIKDVTIEGINVAVTSDVSLIDVAANASLENLVIKDCELNGNLGSKYAQKALSINSTNTGTITFDGCDIKNVGRGLYSSSGFGGTLKVVNCNFENSNSWAIQWNGSMNEVYVDNCTFTACDGVIKGSVKVLTFTNNEAAEGCSHDYALGTRNKYVSGVNVSESNTISGNKLAGVAWDIVNDTTNCSGNTFVK